MKLAAALALIAGCANADLGEVQGQILIMPKPYQATALFQTAPLAVFSDGACTAFEFFATTHDISAGVIDVIGPDRVFGIEPFEAGYYSPEVGIDVGPGEQVTVTAPGGNVPGFTLTAAGVEPFPGSGPDQTPPIYFPGFDGAPITITWTPSSAPSDAIVAIDGLAQMHHGGDPRSFHCEGPDTGSLTMTGAFTAYLRQSAWGGGGALTRFHRDVHVEPDYVVELRVGAYQTVYFNDDLAGAAAR